MYANSGQSRILMMSVISGHELKKAFTGNQVMSYFDPYQATEVWKEIFLQIADKHAPLRLRKVKSEIRHG